MIWQHRAVKGVTLWGYIFGQTWLANAGIVNADSTERAAMIWLRNYLAGATPP